jgi:hypothetical protein
MHVAVPETAPRGHAAMAGDVTAVLFTIGEPYTDRALASLHRQTLAPREILTVSGVSPFYRAMNTAARRVRTEFFLHVDADMILDSTCLTDLRACMGEGVAMAIGGLRDPLRGSIVGVKLYRTRCVAAQPWPNSISPAVDFVNAIVREGWMTVHALKFGNARPALRHTFGEHLPDYNPFYTFMKFQILGARYRYWENGDGVRRMLKALQASAHPAALIAQIATAHGLFWTTPRDQLRPYDRSPEFDALERFMSAPPSAPPAHPLLAPGTDVQQAFIDFYRTAVETRAANAYPAFVAQLHRLAAEPGVVAWAALVGLCHGLFAERYDFQAVASDFNVLTDLLPLDCRTHDS